LHCTEKKAGCQPQTTIHFSHPYAYTVRSEIKKGGSAMRETNDPYADLEDLLFDEDSGGPSER